MVFYLVKCCFSSCQLRTQASNPLFASVAVKSVTSKLGFGCSGWLGIKKEKHWTDSVSGSPDSTSAPKLHGSGELRSDFYTLH